MELWYFTLLWVHFYIFIMFLIFFWSWTWSKNLSKCDIMIMFNLIMITFMIRLTLLWSHLKMADVNYIFINVLIQLQNQTIMQYIQEEEWLNSDILSFIQTYLQRTRNSKIRIQRYAEDVVPSYSLTDSQRHFRLSKSCFEIILNELGNVSIWLNYFQVIVSNSLTATFDQKWSWFKQW